MSLITAIATATELERRLAVFEGIYGDRWPAMVAEIEPGIREKMRTLETDNPLKVASVVGKEIAADGEDPNFLMAVCCHLALHDAKAKKQKP